MRELAEAVSTSFASSIGGREGFCSRRRVSHGITSQANPFSLSSSPERKVWDLKYYSQ